MNETAADIRSLLVWIPAITAAITAATAIATTWLAHHYSSRRQDRSAEAGRDKERRALRRERLERLVELVLSAKQTMHEAAVEHVARQYASTKAAAETPLARLSLDHSLTTADGIQELYFPELHELTILLMGARKDYLQFLGEESRLASNEGQDWLKRSGVGFAERAARALHPMDRETRNLLRRAKELLANELP